MVVCVTSCEPCDLTLFRATGLLIWTCVTTIYTFVKLATLLYAETLYTITIIIFSFHWKPIKTSQAMWAAGHTELWLMQDQSNHFVCLIIPPVNCHYRGHPPVSDITCLYVCVIGWSDSDERFRLVWRLNPLWLHAVIVLHLFKWFRKW